MSPKKAGKAKLEKIKRIKLGKRGEETFAINIILYIIGTMIFFVLMGYLWLYTLKVSSSTHNIENYLAEAKIAFSDGSIFSHDPFTKNSYPGIIEPNNFKDSVFEYLFGSSKDIGIRLAVGGNEIFFNKELYETAEYVYEDPASYFKGSEKTFIVNENGENKALELGIRFEVT